MNLHGIASQAIGAVNPQVPGVVAESLGYTTDDTGNQVPSYRLHLGVRMQVQALDAKALAHLDSLNIQGVVKRIWLNGDWQGIVRGKGKGGDLIILGGITYLIVHVFETWPDWSSVGVTLQLDNR